MLNRENLKEWPLVVFTISLQYSCGLALAATMVDFRAPSAEVELLRPIGIAIFPIVAVGTFFSLCHLGQPLSAWKSVLNLVHSRLSLEILMTILFALSALADSAFWLTGRTEFRLAVGIATFILGLAAVASSAAIYMVPSRPFWNSGWLPTSFLATTILLGGAFASTLFASTGNSTMLRPLLALTIAGGVLSFFSICWMLIRFSRLSRDKFAAISVPIAWRARSLGSWFLFGLYVLFAGIVPIALIITLWPIGNAPSDASAVRFALPGFVAILLGVTAGRTLMYSIGTTLSRF
jgi:anaerobic dimethyl sulfoxide reductase subunit C (anchor subunit)